VSGTPTSVTAGDFDSDGKLDLAVGNVATPTISLFKGHGDATFGPEVALQAAPYGAVWLRAVDIDGDGKTDLVGLSGGLSIYGGNGDGTFRPPLHYASASTPWDGAIADFDLDGRLDIAVGSHEDGGGTPVGYGLLRNLGCK
jgi:hypothetical protein